MRIDSENLFDPLALCLDFFVSLLRTYRCQKWLLTGLLAHFSGEQQGHRVVETSKAAVEDRAF